MSMKSIRIFQAIDLTTGQSVQLDKAASNHLVRVLRLKPEQKFTLFNGNGGEFSASLEIAGKTAIAHITDFSEPVTESPLSLHLYQGISKGDRMDFVIQKSVELGANSITPVFTARTVVSLKQDRLDKKIQHWQSIANSACEQCGRNIVPSISPAVSFTEALQLSSSELKLLLDPLDNNGFSNLASKTNSVDFLIGPEGGLTEEEINQAKESAYSGIGLGPRILRTETAALAAITTAQILWGDFN